jgi:hypothetical protein
VPVDFLNNIFYTVKLKARTETEQERLIKEQNEARKLTITEARHNNVRKLRLSSTPLEDIPYQLFIRLVGLFFDIPDDILRNPQKRIFIKKFRKLRAFIDGQLNSRDGENFARYEMNDYVHNLYVLLVDVISIEFLEANIYAVRDEYRNHVGEQGFRLYVISAHHERLEDLGKKDHSDPKINKEYEQVFRCEYKNLINENRKSRLLKKHIEDTRNFLIRVLMKTYLIILSIFTVIVSLVVIFYTTTQPGDINDVDHNKGILSNLLSSNAITPEAWAKAIKGIIILCIAAVAGATGSYLSALLRILGIRDNNELAQNIVAFKLSYRALRLAPLLGMLFAIILSLLFASGLIGGTLFPEVYKNQWMEILFDGKELSKWIIWCLIAGFSERLIPDMLDKLSDEAKKADDKQR